MAAFGCEERLVKALQKEQSGNKTGFWPRSRFAGLRRTIRPHLLEAVVSPRGLTLNRLPLRRFARYGRADCIGFERGTVLAFTSWRGVVGNIKPTMRPGSVEELCRILPEGVGIIPLFLDIQRGAREEFTTIIPHYEPLIAKLADHDVDLIHPEGAPPFMVLGYKGEAELIKKWEKRYKVPIFTSGTNHIRALEALKVKRFTG